MKINKLILLNMVFVSLASAVDVSYDTGIDQTMRNEKSMSVKNAQDKKRSNRNYTNRSNASTSSVEAAYSSLPVYIELADECVRVVATSGDFGLNSILDDGMIDLNKKAYYDTAGSAGMNLADIEEVDEEKLREHIRCVTRNAARMAYANVLLAKRISGKTFTSESLDQAAGEAWEQAEHFEQNRFILKQFAIADKAAANAKCRFLPSMNNTVQCGAVVLSFADNSVKLGGTMVSPAESFYGVHSTFRVSMNESLTQGNEHGDEASSTQTSDTTLAKHKSNSMNRSSKKTTNISPFIPK